MFMNFLKTFSFYAGTFFLFLNSFSAPAQNAKAPSERDRSIDSLKKLLSEMNTQAPDTQLLQVLNALCRNYDNLGLYSEADSFAVREIAEAKRMHSLFYEATGLQNRGLVLYEQAKYEQCLNYYLEALKIRESLNDPKYIALLINNIGLVYMALGKRQEALGYYYRSRDLFEKLGKNNSEYLRGQGNTLNNIGLVYYYDMKFDSSLYFFEGALELRKQVPDEHKLAESYINIGNAWFMKKDYPKTIKFYTQGMALLKKLGDQRDLSVMNLNLGELFFTIGNKKDAFARVDEAIAISKNIKARDIEKACYDLLQGKYFSFGDYKNAYNYHKLMSDLKDSMLNEVNQKQIAEMQTRYETEKKDKELIRKDAEIVKKDADAKQKNIQRNALVVGLALMAVLAFFIFRGYRQKQKANVIITSQKAEVELQKTKVEKQKEIIEEKQKDILDSIRYAKRIQQSLLPSEKYIHKALKKREE